MLRRIARWPLALILLFTATDSLASDRPLLIDDFEAGLRPGWEAREFKGRTEYAVVGEGAGRVLQATSRAAASGLVYKISYDPKAYPVLTWRWKVGGILSKGDETRKEGDDFSARVYVVFPHWLFLKTKTLSYVWANRLPKGRQVPSPFTSNAAIIAVQSGPDGAGRWITERRNIVDDYRAFFGEDPPKVGAVALMTDTDNTGESAMAWYDDIRVETR